MSMTPAAVQSFAHGIREPRWWLLCVAYLAFVVYGSLVPFEWRDVPWDEAVLRFSNIRYLDLGAASRADWVANIVLYVPLGFLGCAALFGLRLTGPLAALGALLVFLACVAIAVAVEFTQIFFAPRTVSLNDLIAETIGAAIGVSVWLFGRWRIVRLGLAFARGGRESVLAALVVFIVTYVLLSLFPYDFVVSRAELDGVLRARGGAVFSLHCGDWLRCAAFWFVEAAAIAPLGLLLGLLYPRVPMVWLFGLGLGIGLVLEPLQLLLVSGESRAFSVALRGAGVLAGAAAARLLTTRLDIAAVAAALWRAVPWLALPYVLAVTGLSGWWSGPWSAGAQVARELSELGWVPFYYHYWTSEPVAMVSLLSQLGLYAPVGIAAWSRALAAGGRRTQAWWPAVLALLLAVVIETGKLFASGARPDPTNLLVAPVGAWLAFAVATWFGRVLDGRPSSAPLADRPARRGAELPRSQPRRASAPQPSREPARHALAGAVRGPRPMPESASTQPPGDQAPPPRAIPAQAASTVAPASDAQPSAARRGAPFANGAVGAGAVAQPLPEPTVLGYLYALGCGGVAAVGVVLYPVAQVWLALALLLFAAALWRWPWLWLAAVPALLPVLDLTPWSGRVLLEAFDLFVLVGLAVVGLRLSGIKPARLPNAWLAVGLVLLWLSWFLSMGMGLAPAAGGDLPLASSHPPLAPWHAGKGLLWALLAVPLLRRLRRLLGSTAAARLVLPGAVVGLLVVVLMVVLERLAFVGLWNFGTAFRVTGPFASMRDGGGYIGAYIAFALPLLGPWLIVSTARWQRILGVVLAVAVGYALLVTYARAAYLGVAVGLGVLLLGVAVGRLIRGRRQWVMAGGVVAVLVLGSLPVLMTGFAQVRLSQAGADLRARLDHWQGGLGVMGQSLLPVLVGAGFGRYPALYLFAERGPVPPGTYEVVGAGDDPFLRLGKGQAVYLDQRVSVQARTPYQLSVRLRGGIAGARLSLMLCEKALLYSFTCVSTGLAPDEPGVWQRLSATLGSGAVGRGGPWPRGPVKLSLYNSGQGAIEVDALSLTGPDDRELVRNGGFDDGAERWLFVTDQAQGWHLDQLLLETHVAQGLLGLLALGMLMVAVATVLWPGIRAGRLEAVAFAAALAGLLSVGMLGSVVDAPRTAMLFYLGAFCAAVLVRGGEPKGRRRRSGRRRPGARQDDSETAAATHR